MTRIGVDLTDSFGVYISVPFCRAKCTYCNFASGVFGAERMDRYVDRVCAEIGSARRRAEQVGAELPGCVDTIFFGGGTPSLLGAEQMRRLFAALRGEFAVSADAEVTLECAPGQLSDDTLDEMLRQGMNRVSFGVQSFVDAEAKAVGRLHTRAMCLAEIARMRAAGVENINVDLIVGLPGQTAATWRESLEVALETAVPHVSVYMLEVDEDSRLGRELLGAGSREQGTGIALKYGAEAVATDDAIAEWYGVGCEWLEADGVRQYEISNFARVSGISGKDNDGDSDSSSQNDASKGVECGRDDFRSRHNVKYWRRENYVGFGMDAHSMLRTGQGGMRWANTDDLERYLAEREQGTGNGEQTSGGLAQLGDGGGPVLERVGKERAFEEAMFLGLRMNEGVSLEALRAEFGEGLMRGAVEALGDVVEAGLVRVDEGRVRLTARGRMVSNEVFSRLLVGVGV
jgi:oxygen-independent coproporphyrinogen-3 oxidase